MKWLMSSRAGYKCQIVYTDSSGNCKYHVIRPFKICLPEYYYVSYSNMAATKNRC